MLSRVIVRYLPLGLLLIACAACAPIPAANPTPSPQATILPPATMLPTESVVMTPTQPVTAAPTLAASTATATNTPASTANTALTATQAATQTATPPPQTPGTPVASDSNNLFAAVLGQVSAPAGWTVRPCEGDGPFLCVLKGQEEAGALQLSIFPIETMTNFRGMLTRAGLPAGPIDPTDASQRTKLLAAVGSFVEEYHTVIQADRQVEYGANVRYMRLDNQQVMVGALPGMRYGFVGLNKDESVFERWVSYVAYDGDLMYILVASYRPGAIPTFRSDEELTEFLPHLDQIVAGLRLPLPVLPTSVASVRALRSLEIFRSYSAEAGNPVGQVAAGQTVPVKGMSPTGRHWQINCPDPAQRSCWIAGTADSTDPPAR